MVIILSLMLVFLILVFIGVPIAYSFGLATIFYMLISDPTNLVILISRSFGSLDSFALMAIPFFILAGDVMKGGEISRYLVQFVNIFVSKIKGGLSHVVVISSTFFGAISGSSAATVAAIGGIMIPEMVKRGYDRNFAVAISAVSGFIGILIPPSIPLIVYGLNAQVSVEKLFLAGIIPGILFAVGFIIVNLFMVRKYKTGLLNESTLEKDENSLTEHMNRYVVIRAIPALIMPVIILGGIYSGVFTPTESGAVAAFYGILVSFLFYRSINLKKLVKIASESALTSTVILFVIGLAGVFGWLITTQRVPEIVSQFVTSITTNPIIILIILNIFYLILGTFLETVTAIIITTPIFLPLIQTAGIDLIHFGIIQTANLCVGLITPPMALNLLIASKMGDVPMMSVIKPLLPYLAVSLIILIIITYIPSISLFLPNLFLSN